MSTITKSKIEKLGTINTVQPRVATGNLQDASTNVYVIRGRFCNDDIGVTTRRDDYDDSSIVGYYEIIHPSIMAGSFEEIHEDFCRIVISKLEESGKYYYNPYGIMFERS